MTDYTELVKALTCGNDGKLPCHNNECPYWVDKWHGIGLCNVIKKDADAAAAIEALQKDLTTLQKCYEIADTNVDEVLKQLPKRGEIVRCRECKWYSIYEAKKDGSPDKRYSPSVCLREIYAKRRDPDWFCADGERKVQDGQ